MICLYRVSTVGQVDHDDIPMQRLACREYAATHPDWEVIDEISEKGVSGYKVSTNARDAIVEIKRRAAQHEFDDKSAGWWWLRSPGYFQNLAADVLDDGSLGNSGVNYDYGVVRPAFWINLESGIF